MSRFNNKNIPVVPRVGAQSGVQTTGEVGVTYEGRLGSVRGPKGELFLLAATFMGGDDNFYEKSSERYDRLVQLISYVVVDDIRNDATESDWFVNFVTWLRSEANMRTVSMVVAVEAVRLRLLGGIFGGNWQIVNAALQRGDEPAEVIAYWYAKHGRDGTIPQPIKRGIEEATTRLYDPYSFLKYGESRSASVNMRDVLRLIHPKPSNYQQDRLFEYILSKDRAAYIREHGTGGGLEAIRARMDLMSMSVDGRREFVRTGYGKRTLKEAGFTWENLSEWLPGGMNAEAWELAIPNMGIMALIRNLRNFDQADISANACEYVQNKIQNPEVVRKSRQLPFRWYNAYRATESVRWAHYLDQALNQSLANIPKLTGKTLVLVDMSGSMTWSNLSPRSSVTYADAAKLFGAAIKLANWEGVDLYQFGTYVAPVELRKGGSVLTAMKKFTDMGGTNTDNALAQTVTSEHDRVILITDEQAHPSYYERLPIPDGKSIYVWNLGGYAVGLAESGRYKVHTFAGLGDSAFKMIPILEAGTSVGWPWDVESVQSPNTTVPYMSWKD